MQQFVIDNGFETIKEELKEKEIMMITDNEEDVQKSKETNSKHPMGRIRTISMVKIEKQFQIKDKIFTTYEKKSRKCQQVQKGKIADYDDESQQIQYAYIQNLEYKKNKIQ